MREVTVKIPENDFAMFMELVRKLGFQVTEDIEVPESHKRAVRNRIKASEKDPNLLLDWEKAQDKLKFP